MLFKQKIGFDKKKIAQQQCLLQQHHRVRCQWQKSGILSKIAHPRWAWLSRKILLKKKIINETKRAQKKTKTPKNQIGIFFLF